MLDILQTQAFEQDLKTINKPDQASFPFLVTGIDGSARAVYIAKLFQSQPCQMVVVESNHVKLVQLVEDLTSLLPTVNVLTFPSEESLALEYSIASLEGVAQRVEVLQTLHSGEPVIIVTGVSGLRKRLTPVEEWQKSQKCLTVGSEIERDDLEKHLFNLGYQKVSMVMSPGEFSVRGSIVDFYPLNSSAPIRLDFFDTDLDSIRYFDAESQMSQANINQIVLEPVIDILFSPAQQYKILPILQKHYQKALENIKDVEYREQFQKVMGQQLESLSQGEGLSHASAFLSYFDSHGTCLLDYMHASGRLVVNEFSKVHQMELQMIETDQFWLEQETAKGLLFPKQKLKLSAYEVIRTAQQQTFYFSVVPKGMGKVEWSAVFNYQYRSMNPFFNQMPLVKTEMDHWLKQDHSVQVVVESDARAGKVQELFAENQMKATIIRNQSGIESTSIQILVGSLSQGFELPLDFPDPV